MKTKVVGLGILIFSVVTGAYIFTRGQQHEVFAAEPEPYYLNRVNELYRENVKLMSSSYHAVETMSGGGFMYGIEEIGHGYMIPVEQSSVEEARRAVVTGVEHLLTAFNHDQVVLPYLKNGALTVEECDFWVNYARQGDTSGNGLAVAFAATVKDQIMYAKYNAETKRYETILKEPYAKALAIIQAEDLSQGDIDLVQ